MTNEELVKNNMFLNPSLAQYDAVLKILKFVRKVSREYETGTDALKLDSSQAPQDHYLMV